MPDLPPDELKRLRLAANETAAVCADCFAALAPTASVTVKWRFVEHVPMSYSPHPGTQSSHADGDMPPLLAR
jgi:hypothetical protein